MKPKIEAIKLVRDGGVTRVARTIKNFFFPNKENTCSSTWARAQLTLPSFDGNGVLDKGLYLRRFYYLVFPLRIASRICIAESMFSLLDVYMLYDFKVLLLLLVAFLKLMTSTASFIDVISKTNAISNTLFT